MAFEIKTVLAVFTGFLAVASLWLSWELPEKTLFVSLASSIVAAFLSIVGYYFGSSETKKLTPNTTIETKQTVTQEDPK